MKLLNSRRGDIVISSMMAVLFVALIATAVLSLVDYLNKQKKVSRVKSVMQEIEGAIVSHVLDSASFNSVTNELDLIQINARIDSFSRDILGASCAPGVPNCGVALSNPAWDPATREFTATLSYNGNDTSVAAYQVSIVTPDATVIPRDELCDDDPGNPGQPLLFAGPDNCRPAYGLCPEGEYVVSIDARTRRIDCRPISVACTNAARPILGKKVDEVPGGASPIVGLFTPVECIAPFDAYQVWGGN